MALSAALLLFLGLETAPHAARPQDAAPLPAPVSAPAPTPSRQPITQPIGKNESPAAAAQDNVPMGRQQWLDWIAEWRTHQRAMQVRIERRVVIRIPRSTARRQPLSDIQRGQLSRNWEERKIGKCLPMNSIAGVQIASDDQMLLYMRDRRIIRAQLEKACRAREFYSGFYLEQSDDGRLCIDRDVLQSRSGSKCELKRIRQLVARE